MSMSIVARLFLMSCRRHVFMQSTNRSTGTCSLRLSRRLLCLLNGCIDSWRNFLTKSTYARNHHDTKCCRPISNLSVTSEYLERLVAEQLVSYLKAHDLLPTMQSAYRQAFNRDSRDQGFVQHAHCHRQKQLRKFAVLALFHLNAACDTVGYKILLQRL